MAKFSVKNEALKKAIQGMIDEMEDGFHAHERIAIHCEEGYEVQIMVTSNEDEFIGTVFKPYAQAKESRSWPMANLTK